MSSWTLPSIPPHDWFLCLDIDQYFDHEHDPEQVFEEGFKRPIPVGDRDVMITAFFNGNPEEPEFHFESPEPLDRSEIEEANKSLSRILGTQLDLRPLYDKAAGDPVLGSKLTELYGLKRMSRANLFEDTINRIIQMRLSHKPTAKKMVYKVRKNYGSLVTAQGENVPAWPRPHQLVKADPMSIRKLGPTRRKGEFIIGFAEDLLSGEEDLDQLEHCDPQTFYDTIRDVRGVGPTSAQQLMLFRNRTDAVFPSNKSKGKEKGHRRWIIMSYGGDPEHTSEKEFRQMTASWEDYEAAALEFLFVNWILREKEKKQSEE
ncbi:DNA-3-methyladenine glycosylase [Fodinibius sp.]|uniref:DNA-3-methyladenine glycosylase family protein n=1 Tax=Fodinibius sp. TaxID=1872440 RepID=UPI003568B547